MVLGIFTVLDNVVSIVVGRNVLLCIVVFCVVEGFVVVRSVLVSVFTVLIVVSC